MTQEIIRYILEQASGVVIAFVLIVRIESKLDSLTSAIMRLSEAKPTE
ncbi:YvrJ family protein [Lactobacillus gasseri]